MEILNHILQMANYCLMIGCTFIWLWLWRACFNNYCEMQQRIERLENAIQVIKEPCYRGVDEHA